MFEYGKCRCGDHFDSRQVEVRLHVSGRLVVLAGVPQGICTKCGSRVFKPDVLERIEAIFRQEIGHANVHVPRGI